MTRKALNFEIDGLLLKVADANELDISQKETIAICQSLFWLALEKHAEEIVRSATSGNRINVGRKPQTEAA